MINHPSLHMYLVYLGYTQLEKAGNVMLIIILCSGGQVVRVHLVWAQSAPKQFTASSNPRSDNLHVTLPALSLLYHMAVYCKAIHFLSTLLRKKKRLKSASATVIMYVVTLKYKVCRSYYLLVCYESMFNENIFPVLLALDSKGKYTLIVDHNRDAHALFLSSCL